MSNAERFPEIHSALQRAKAVFGDVRVTYVTDGDATLGKPFISDAEQEDLELRVWSAEQVCRERMAGRLKYPSAERLARILRGDKAEV